jgi:methyltransferase (TIGR00027 family)
MAFFRALETARPAGERLFADPLAPACLSGGLRVAAAMAGLPGMSRVLPAIVDLRWRGPRASAVVRTRVIDDAILAAVGRGLEQLVLLGAGYDSRAYRLPGVRDLQVFEVDHPTTQSVKRRIVQDAFGELPRHVRYVPIDFDREPLEAAMAAAGLAAGRRTFVLWEGVMAYLTPEAVDGTLRWASACAGGGSELMFTYVHRGIVDGSTRFPHAAAWVSSVREAGEPFVFGLDPTALPAHLAARGWRLVDDLSTTEALALHGVSMARVPSFYRIARAEPLDGSR